MDHIKFRSSIFACESEDRKLTAGVLGKELGHVQHAVMEDDPAIALGVMLCNLLLCVAASARGFLPCGRGRIICLCNRAALVHAVLIRTASVFGGLHRTGKAAAGQLSERCLLQVVTQHVLCASLACNTTKNHTIQQGVAAEAVVAMHAPSNLTRSVQAGDGLTALRRYHRGVDIDLQTAHAIVDNWCDDGNIEGLSFDLRAINAVVVKLLARTGASAGFVP
mmetsp:Transcript_150851/g.366389  ORF Transcript_150851/g.366389 Transcript_150851/m.366389 type:complete len:222 (-) Transcript_150851:774-1439(-)